MMILHIAFNYLAVRAVCLRILNEPRFLQVIDMYLKEEIISSPCEINRKEPIIFYHFGPNLLDLKKCGFQIKLGNSMKDLLTRNPSASHLNNIMEIYKSRNFLIFPEIHYRKMHVIFEEHATIDDILCAYFHAVLLSIITCAINDSDLSVYYQDNKKLRPFAHVCQVVQTAEWSRQPTTSTDYSLTGFCYEPSYELMKYVDKIANKEWYRIKAGLEQTGWVLSKHLLMVDEWRIRGNVTFSNKDLTSIPNTDETILSTNPEVIKMDDLYESITEEIKNKDPYTIEPDFALAPPDNDLIVKNITQDEEDIDYVETKKEK